MLFLLNKFGKAYDTNSGKQDLIRDLQGASASTRNTFLNAIVSDLNRLNHDTYTRLLRIADYAYLVASISGQDMSESYRPMINKSGICEITKDPSAKLGKTGLYGCHRFTILDNDPVFS